MIQTWIGSQRICCQTEKEEDDSGVGVSLHVRIRNLGSLLIQLSSLGGAREYKTENGYAGSQVAVSRFKLPNMPWKASALVDKYSTYCIFEIELSVQIHGLADIV